MRVGTIAITRVEIQNSGVAGGARVPARDPSRATATRVTAACVDRVAKTPRRAEVRRSRNVAVTRLARATSGSRYAGPGDATADASEATIRATPLAPNTRPSHWRTRTRSPRSGPTRVAMTRGWMASMSAVVPDETPAAMAR